MIGKGNINPPRISRYIVDYELKQLQSHTVVLRTVETEHGQDRNCGARGSLSHRCIVLPTL